MVRPLIVRCMSKMLPLVAGLDRVCFLEPIPGDELLTYPFKPKHPYLRHFARS